MSKITVLDNDYAALWYYDDSKVVHHKFHKFIYGEQLHDVLSQGLAIFKKHGANKWLSDDRNNSALPQSDLDWAQENWLTAMVDAGWKYWAIVLPDSTVGKANMNRIITSYVKQGIRVETFETPEDALQWLDSVQ